ncbi:MAG: hypothetical protein WC787_01125 [Patescibacteria group bacterium]|jgi:D-alanyl-D-alanine dipeptidase
MKRRTLFAGLFVLAFACTLALPISGSAQTTIIAPRLNVPIPGLDFTQHPATRDGNKLTIPFLAAYVGAFYKYLVGVSAIAAAIMIVYGGFLYIAGTSLGDVGRGKAKIRDALIGLMLILGSYILLWTLNAGLVEFKGLTVTVISRESASWILKNGDMSPTDHERLGGPISGSADTGSVPLPVPTDASLPSGEVPLTGSDTAFGKMCGKDASINVPEARPCADREGCYQKYCVGSAKIEEVAGFPKDEQIKKFDYFPKDAGGQISEYGIAFIGSSGMFPGVTKRVSDAKVLSFSGGTVGGKKVTYYDQDGKGMLPDAHEALIRAGKIAKSKGYFIIPQDMTRTMTAQVTAFCARVKQLKDEGKPGTGGLALPGGSSHQFGYALDAVLAKLNDDGTFEIVTNGGPVCDAKSGVNEIDNAVAYGLENARLFQAIMAQAGFKRLCSEMWHFDYKGVYSSDCGECFFPPKMREDLLNCKGRVRYCKEHSTEGSCKELL